MAQTIELYNGTIGSFIKLTINVTYDDDEGTYHIQLSDGQTYLKHIASEDLYDLIKSLEEAQKTIDYHLAQLCREHTTIYATPTFA